MAGWSPISLSRTAAVPWGRNIEGRRWMRCRQSAEGELGLFVKARSRVTPVQEWAPVEGTEDEERGRRWGIQFECKGE